MHYFWSRSTCIIGRCTTAAIEVVLFLMQVHTQCSGRGEDGPCSQCLGDDPQPFCSTKPLSWFDFLLLTGNFAPALAITTRRYTDYLTKTISTSQQNYNGKIPETDFCALLSWSANLKR